MCRHRSTLLRAEQDWVVDVHRICDCEEVIGSLFEGHHAAIRGSIGASVATTVVKHKPRERGQPGKKASVRREVPAHVERLTPCAEIEEVSLAVTCDLIRDRRVAAPRVEDRPGVHPRSLNRHPKPRKRDRP